MMYIQSRYPSKKVTLIRLISIKNRCCNVEIVTEKIKLDSLDSVEILTCHRCGRNVGVVYDGVKQNPDDFLLDQTKSAGCHWLEAKQPKERVVHYVLCQLKYTPDESRGEVPYDMPDPEDITRLCWRDQAAVGFYTVKPNGPTQRGDMLGQDGMPTLDTAFILPQLRGLGLGTSLLQDFLASYPDRDLAVSHPLSYSMWMVLKNFLQQNIDLRRKLWLVKGDCEEGNRTLVWFCLQRMGK